MVFVCVWSRSQYIFSLCCLPFAFRQSACWPLCHRAESWSPVDWPCRCCTSPCSSAGTARVRTTASGVHHCPNGTSAQSNRCIGRTRICQSTRELHRDLAWYPDCTCRICYRQRRRRPAPSTVPPTQRPVGISRIASCTAASRRMRRPGTGSCEWRDAHRAYSSWPSRYLFCVDDGIDGVTVLCSDE